MRLGSRFSACRASKFRAQINQFAHDRASAAFTGLRLGAIEPRRAGNIQVCPSVSPVCKRHATISRGAACRRYFAAGDETVRSMMCC
jgi:hypothetical protein